MGMRAPVGKAVAVQRAKELYAKFGKTEDGRINVEQIAHSLGITVLYHPMEDDSGILLVKDRKAVVVINDRHHENRKRFSLAHEIAHYLLHYTEGVEVFHRDLKSSLGTTRIEIDANAFAGELLMPEADIRAWVESTHVDFLDDAFERDLADKARALGVSSQALGIRLERLGLLKPDYSR